jgi:hypothetical protein
MPAKPKACNATTASRRTPGKVRGERNDRNETCLSVVDVRLPSDRPGEVALRYPVTCSDVIVAIAEIIDEERRPREIRARWVIFGRVEVPGWKIHC